MLNYVVKRILMMIPTLFVISIIVFVIIQLPPGDYLETYIAELQSQGESVDESKMLVISCYKEIKRESAKISITFLMLYPLLIFPFNRPSQNNYNDPAISIQISKYFVVLIIVHCMVRFGQKTL